MQFNTRLSAAAHALLQLAGNADGVTTEALGTALQTNFNVVRQNMTAFRAAGLVRSVGDREGRGGRWSLSREPEQISLRDVYVALGEPALFVVRNRSEDGECIVETVVDKALAEAFGDAQAALLVRLGQTSLAALSLDFQWHAG